MNCVVGQLSFLDSEGDDILDTLVRSCTTPKVMGDIRLKVTAFPAYELKDALWWKIRNKAHLEFHDL